MVVAVTDRPRQLDLGPLFLLLAVTCVVAVVYIDSFRSMFGVLGFDSNSQGLLVFPISAFLLWKSRAQLAGALLRPWAAGVPILIALALLWALSRELGVQAGEHLTAVLFVPATVATILGWDLARRAAFPLLFLLVAVPVGDAFIPYLMSSTADVAAVLLRAAGVPVYRDGNLLSLPGGEFEVAEVCSGIRSLVAGTTIALLFSYFTFRRASARVAFVAVTDLALILVNGVRAFVVMWVASATQMRVFAGNDHVVFGWVLFGCVMTLLFWWGARLAGAPMVTAQTGFVPPNAGSASPAFPHAVLVALLLGLVMLAMTAQPLGPRMSAIWLIPGGALILWLMSRSIAPATAGFAPSSAGHGDSYRRPVGVLVLAAAAAVLVSGPLLLGAGPDDADTQVRRVSLPTIGGCTAEDGSWGTSDQPQWPQPDVAATGVYECNGGNVRVLAAGFSAEAQTKDLVGAHDRAVPASWKKRSEIGTNTFGAPTRGTTQVNQLLVEYAGRQSLIWYWFALGERRTRSALVLKLMMLAARLRGANAVGVAYWLETPLQRTGDPSAGQRLATVAPAVDLALASLSVQEGPR